MPHIKELSITIYYLALYTESYLVEFQNSIGDQIRLLRQQKNLSQAELAFKCNIHLRNIQRIERNDIVPRVFNLRVIGEILEIELISKQDAKAESAQITKYRLIYKRIKRTRLVTICFAIFLLISAFVLMISGIPKVYWAPFLYFFFFVDFIIVGMVWR